MFSRDMQSEIGGYNIRSYKETDEVVTASLYRGKSKVGDIIVNGTELTVAIKNDKEEMNYQTAISENKLDDDFVLSLIDRAEAVVFEESIKEDCKTMTVFSLKSNPDKVRRVERAYKNGGKEWFEATFVKEEVEICYNIAL